MPKTDLLFPAGGEDRSLAFQSQPPFTTRASLNVVPSPGGGQRARGGLRPGFTRYIDQQVEQPIRVMVPYNDITPAGEISFSDQFIYRSGSFLPLENRVWEQAPWLPDSPFIEAGDFAVAKFADGVSPQDNRNAGAVRSTVEMDDTKSWKLVARATELIYACDLAIFGLLSDDKPNVKKNGVELRLEFRGDFTKTTIVLTLYRDGVATTTSQVVSLANIPRPEMTLKFNEDTNTFQGGVGPGGFLTLDAEQLLGTRFGFSAFLTDTNPVAGSFMGFDDYQLIYEPAGGQKYNRKRLFILCGNEITGSQPGYRTSNFGEWFELSSAYPDEAGVGYGVDYLSKVYFTTEGFSAQDNPPIGVFDPKLDTIVRLDSLGTKGSAPRGKLMAVFLDRLTIAGDASAPQVVYQARQGDPLDWDYGQEDVQAAVSSVTSASGQTPEPITALVPRGDDYMIIGCSSTIWNLPGDMRLGGRIYNVSHTVGMFDGGSWCHLPDGSTIILSQIGLYRIVPGAPSNGLEPISERYLPVEFHTLDPAEFFCRMVYDNQRRGVHIYLTARQGAASTPESGPGNPTFQTSGPGGGGNNPPAEGGISGRHWFLSYPDLRLFRVSLPFNYDPWSAVFFDADEPTRRGLVVGGRDGYARSLDPRSGYDDQEEIENFVDIGPIRLSGPDSSREGVLNSLTPVMGRLSGDVNWSIYVGDSEEDAANNADSNNAIATGKWTGGFNTTDWPNVGGQCFILRLSGLDGRSWEMERVTIDRIVEGTQKRLV